MTTFQPAPFLSEILEGNRIPEEKLVYFRARFKNRLHSMVLEQFVKLANDKQFTKADLARKLGKEPSQITRWLGTPGNWELDTVSDLLLGMGYEPMPGVWNLAQGAVHPNKEAWKLADFEPQGDETQTLAPKPRDIDDRKNGNIVEMASYRRSGGDTQRRNFG